MREAPLCFVARRVMNCAGNEIVTYIKASHFLHDCISVTYTWGSLPTFILIIYVLLTVHLGIILVNKQFDSRFFSVYVYFDTLHVSSNHVLIIKRMNCINATSGIRHSM